MALSLGVQVGHVDEALFDAVANRLSRVAARERPDGETLQPGTVARTMWAFTMQGQANRKLFKLLLPHAKVGLALAQWALSALGWGCTLVLWAQGWCGAGRGHVSLKRDIGIV